MTHPWSQHPVTTAGFLGPWLACVSTEVAGAFRWLGPPPSESFFFFQLLCRPAPFICNLRGVGGGGLGAQEALGAEAGRQGLP